jgi:hypothetical protein
MCLKPFSIQGFLFNTAHTSETMPVVRWWGAPQALSDEHRLDTVTSRQIFPEIHTDLVAKNVYALAK